MAVVIILVNSFTPTINRKVLHAIIDAYSLTSQWFPHAFDSKKKTKIQPTREKRRNLQENIQPNHRYITVPWLRQIHKQVEDVRRPKTIWWKGNDQKWIVHISSCATCFNQLSLNSLYDTQSSLTAVPAIFPHSLWLKAYNGAVNLKRDVSIYPKSSPITRGHIVTRLNTRCFLFCSARDEDSCMTVRLLRFFSSVKIAYQHLIPSSLSL